MGGSKAILIKLFQKQAAHHHRLNKVKTQLSGLAGAPLCFDFIDKATTGKINPDQLFVFTSNVLNEEQNVELFESVLTT